MILWSLLPASLAGMIFFGTLRQRSTTQAERERIAASSREFRAFAGRALLMFALLAVPLAALAGVRVFGAQTDLRPMVLR